MGRLRSACETAVSEADAPHVFRANRYIRAVLDGDIPACKWVRLACERQLRDLHSSADPAYPFTFDLAAAERVCKFVELSPHVKGKKFSGRLIHLEDWQCFILTTVFGWLSRSTGLRRFRRTYAEIAKGNGKSALSSPLCNYMGFADNEPGAEVYSAATTRDQAKIVWSTAHAMLRAMPEFCQRAGVDTAAHSINQIETNSFFRPLSSDANSVEGINPYFTCEDELHAHPNRNLHDNLDTANGKREGSMLWIISTAGSDQAGICYEVRSYVVKILEGTAQDDSFFGIIFTIDDEDDWASGPEVWRKANPNWGISVDPEEFARKIQKAIQLASAQPSTKTKHLNVWVNADHAWMDMLKFRKCADVTLTEEAFLGEPCVIGLDLANKIDILAKLKLFWRDEGDEEKRKRHYYAFGTYWLPEAQVELAQNSQYEGWAIENRVLTCPGEVNDFDLVEESIRDDAQRFQVREVAHDPWNAVQIVNHLQTQGIVMVKVDQIPKNLSEPMRELEAAVYDGRFHYNGDPVLEWAISNVVAHRDRNDNLFPTKEKPEKKIDPASALLNAINRVMFIDITGGGDVGVIGRCSQCGEYVAGKVQEGGKVVFDCGKHTS